MDVLKRELAPLTSEVWEEIDAKAGQVLKANLSARKAVKVVGPKGWDHTVVAEGRLDLLNEDGNVKSGIYKAKPLVEARINFTLNRWEMDNIVRGAKDIDLDALEDAVRELAYFEEKSIYEGFEKGGIVGLKEASENESIPFGIEGTAIMDSISKGLILLREAYADKPFTLIVGKEAWRRLNMEIQGTPLINRIEALMDGTILYSPVVEDAFLIPYDHDDLELTIGQDFSIGYETHDEKTVRLFITESFTFRVLDPKLIVHYTI
ncbi:MAG: bacteriocin family protein [Clostridiaceae bacterium]|nr:bacteriocin family protein [Clostridiaceae bacterium]